MRYYFSFSKITTGDPDNKAVTKMFCTIIIMRYPKYLGLFGFLSMFLFRFPLWFNKKIKFWKLMGSSKSGSFGMRPDFNQWALLFSSDLETSTCSFINVYCKFFRCTMKRFIMQPVTAHGSWDGKQVFCGSSKLSKGDGPVAVLTRATIRLNRLKNFWNNVDTVAEKLKTAEGLILSYGIGEMPFIKQATFSVWEDESSMKAFAYGMREHADVIRRTRNEDWYKEELFVRFRIIGATASNENNEAKMRNLPALYEEA